MAGRKAKSDKLDGRSKAAKMKKTATNQLPLSVHFQMMRNAQLPVASSSTQSNSRSNVFASSSNVLAPSSCTPVVIDSKGPSSPSKHPLLRKAAMKRPKANVQSDSAIEFDKAVAEVLQSGRTSIFPYAALSSSTDSSKSRGPMVDLANVSPNVNDTPEDFEELLDDQDFKEFDDEHFEDLLDDQDFEEFDDEDIVDMPIDEQPVAIVSNDSEDSKENNIVTEPVVRNDDYACRTYEGTVYAIVDWPALQSAHLISNPHVCRSKMLLSIVNIGTTGARPAENRAYEYAITDKKFKNQPQYKMIRIHRTTVDSTTHKCIFHELVFWESALHSQAHLYTTTLFARQAGMYALSRYKGIVPARSFSTDVLNMVMESLVNALLSPVVIHPNPKFTCAFCDYENRFRCRWATHTKRCHDVQDIESYLLDDSSYVNRLCAVKKKFATDPAYRQRKLERWKNRYQTDPVFRQQEIDRQKNRRAKRKK
ncbi:hypothetical protein M3Y96_01045800 [Aphelenchoides besseyi]|nr:hypothetical protein M3Y96_01045800 [Aphelenchoides besseyi]